MRPFRLGYGYPWGGQDDTAPAGNLIWSYRFGIIQKVSFYGR